MGNLVSQSHADGVLVRGRLRVHSGYKGKEGCQLTLFLLMRGRVMMTVVGNGILDLVNDVRHD